MLFKFFLVLTITRRGPAKTWSFFFLLWELRQVSQTFECKPRALYPATPAPPLCFPSLLDGAEKCRETCVKTGRNWLAGWQHPEELHSEALIPLFAVSSGKCPAFLA